ncbi:hypothetical protein HNO92_002169 [Chromobacterium alkanivorans]|uniref:hypothetical protein n=1 Tax=Chromobacterium TaxID=535 RepID=UPI000B24EEBB|nr:MULTISPECIES: hypothetical protein [Chromobacterium]MBN3004442.1 hypothetical protein [Chromobacterium alkanivorans]MCS3805094.1 hypothetical protein [Chromobacterium alkanivorans]MCS3819343.1 hypothetical protein [Chromobacterium alkanivorans]MCS3873855.1 hypothetical protein [Chromobacterium alkanivorans]
MACKLLMLWLGLAVCAGAMATCLPQAWACASPADAGAKALPRDVDRDITLGGLRFEREAVSNRLSLSPVLDLNKQAQLSLRLTPKQFGLRLKVNTD